MRTPSAHAPVTPRLLRLQDRTGDAEAGFATRELLKRLPRTSIPPGLRIVSHRGGHSARAPHRGEHA